MTPWIYARVPTTSSIANDIIWPLLSLVQGGKTPLLQLLKTGCIYTQTLLSVRCHRRHLTWPTNDNSITDEKWQFCHESDMCPEDSLSKRTDGTKQNKRADASHSSHNPLNMIFFPSTDWAQMFCCEYISSWKANTHIWSLSTSSATYGAAALRCWYNKPRTTCEIGSTPHYTRWRHDSYKNYTSIIIWISNNWAVYSVYLTVLSWTIQLTCLSIKVSQDKDTITI